MRTDLHEERLDLIARALVGTGARTVLDLGCGAGELLSRLLEEPRFERLVGVDISPSALDEARWMLGVDPFAIGGRVRLIRGSFTDAGLGLTGFDAAALVETIEHVDPRQLSAIERAVFGAWRPTTAIVTTPNVEYNVVYGLRPGEVRHPDHRFEWSRARFRDWAAGVAARNRYQVAFSGIGDAHPLYGQPTQVATLRRSERG